MALKAGALIALVLRAEDLSTRVRSATGGLRVDETIVAIVGPSLAKEAIGIVRHLGRISLFAEFSKGEKAEFDTAEYGSAIKVAVVND